MWEAVACVPDLVAILTFVEVPCEHLLLIGKVCFVEQSVVWHFYHGIHLEARQFKVTKQVRCFDAGHRLPVVTYHPWYETNTVKDLLLLDQVYVGKLFDVRDAVDLILVSVEQVVVAQEKEHIVKVRTKLLEPAHTVIQRANVDHAAIMMPVAAKDAVLTAPFFGLFDHPFNELLTASIVLAAIVTQSIVDVSEVHSL